MQLPGSGDSALGMLAFVVNVARGAGLPTQHTYSLEQIHELRAHLVTIILFYSLDPPRDPYRTRMGLQQLMAPRFSWPERTQRSGEPPRRQGWRYPIGASPANNPLRPRPFLPGADLRPEILRDRRPGPWGGPNPPPR